jgi:hypothetical protein
MAVKKSGSTPVLPEGYKLPDYEERLAFIKEKGGAYSNLEMGNWLAGGRGVEGVSGMSPADYYNIYGPDKVKDDPDGNESEAKRQKDIDPAVKGSISVELAKALEIPTLKQ